jgi:hypothetical protein
MKFDWRTQLNLRFATHLHALCRDVLQHTAVARKKPALKQYRRELRFPQHRDAGLVQRSANEDVAISPAPT